MKSQIYQDHSNILKLDYQDDPSIKRNFNNFPDCLSHDDWQILFKILKIKRVTSENKSMIKKKKLRKIKVLWQFLFSNWFVVDKAVAKEKIFHFSFVPIVIDKIFGIKKVDFSFFFQFESFQITFYYFVWLIATLLEDPPSLLDVDTHE